MLSSYLKHCRKIAIHGTPFTFPLSFKWSSSSLIIFCPWLHAEVVEASCLVLPSNWPPACWGPVDWSKNLLPLFVCHSSFAWFRLTVFLASLARRRARVNSILEPLPMLVLALIVCALSESGSLSEILGVWKWAHWLWFPQAPLSLSQSLFPFSYCVFLFKNPPPTIHPPFSPLLALSFTS